MKKFTVPHKTRFSECDATGLVLHPHFFMWAVDTIEEFFSDKLKSRVFGHGITENIYTLMAGARAEFASPVEVGDEVVFNLWIERLGRTSIHWAFVITKGDRVCVKIAETLVFTLKQSDGTFVTMPIPEEFRPTMQEFTRDESKPLLAFRS